MPHNIGGICGWRQPKWLMRKSPKLVPQYKRFWNPGGSIVHTGTHRQSEISHVTDGDNDNSHSLILSLSQTIFKPRTETHTHTHTQTATQTYTMSCRRHAVQYNIEQTFLLWENETTSGSSQIDGNQGVIFYKKLTSWARGCPRPPPLPYLS